MSIKDKLQNAENTTWLTEVLTQEEKVAAAMSAEIASFLQKYRKLHGLTQDGLAEILQVSNEEVIRWENGDE